MVDRSSSKRCVPIRIRLAVSFFFQKKTKGVSSSIGRALSCRERKYRIEAGLTRFFIYNFQIIRFFFSKKNASKKISFVIYYIKKEKLPLVRRDIC